MNRLSLLVLISLLALVAGGCGSDDGGGADEDPLAALDAAAKKTTAAESNRQEFVMESDIERRRVDDEGRGHVQRRFDPWADDVRNGELGWRGFVRGDLGRRRHVPQERRRSRCRTARSGSSGGPADEHALAVGVRHVPARLRPGREQGHGGDPRRADDALRGPVDLREAGRGVGFGDRRTSQADARRRGHEDRRSTSGSGPTACPRG